ncbi:sulfotransferase family protein [Thiohalorhabdus sp. Cl-TMA]|uniref:Sulfotransferase n=1 Tax=Thiohalorhabdus methylotrophus TaxID=3242694 RepID=A0ABV4TV14_9GAMM
MGKHEGEKTGFHVDTWVHVLSGWISRHPGLWTRLGNLETRLLADPLAGVAVQQPVYIAGLARAGSTLLLELLNAHPEVATHRYRDFPFLFTPYMWNRFLDRVPRREGPPTERTHGDGIRITPESPEAFEEMLWMAFFPDLHAPSNSNVLNQETSRPEFERFYRDHIRKLLLVRDGSRYVSKGNYNATRLEYLQKLYGDARFLIPVRDPVWHIASLMKQQRLFCAGQRGNPRALAHLQRVGHFEFGEDRRPVNAGDSSAVEAIRALWAQGAEVEGWARYWAHIHSFLADRLESSPQLAEAALIVRYEELCDAPDQQLQTILEHCRLSQPDAVLDLARRRVRFPTYYEPSFSPEELETIRQWTEPTAHRLGLSLQQRVPA